MKNSTQPDAWKFFRIVNYIFHSTPNRILMNFLRLCFVAAALLAGTFAFGQVKFSPMDASALSEGEQDEVEGVVKSYLEAVSNEDLDAMAALLDDEFKGFNLWSEEPVTKEEELEGWARDFKNWDNITTDMAITSLTMTPAEGDAWDLVMLLGQAGWDDVESGVEGVKMMLRLDVEVKDGKITSMWSYFDRMSVQQQYEAAADGE